MSRPPSPQHQDTSKSGTVLPSSIADTALGSTSAQQTSLPASSQVAATTLGSEPLPSQSIAGPVLSDPTRVISSAPAATTATTASVADVPKQAGSAPAATSAVPRPVRRTTAHVASACVNCKRAHLSCDVQRPCQRCINTGKQDTCFDVQHKKRGRPRLREEVDATQASSSRQTTSLITQQTPHRPIASTRSRRADSYQSHHSRGSESSSYGQITPGSATFPPQYGHLFVSTGMSPIFEIPTAFLDLDLRILRANAAFEHLVAAGRSLSSARLSDYVVPLGNEDFLTMRNRLRSEREQKEPSYLPPIVQSGQDPLQTVQETDLDRLTQGFSDVSYTWMVAAGGASFPARVRLGKALTYFVAVTLPPIQVTSYPVLQTVTSAALQSSMVMEMSPVDRQSMATAAQFQEMPASGMPRDMRTAYPAVLQPAQRLTGPPTPSQDVRAQMPQQTPPLLYSERPTLFTPTVPSQTMPMGYSPVLTRPAYETRLTSTHEQALPPIFEASQAVPEHPTLSTALDDVQSSEDGSGDPGPSRAKRRRGMGINEVLHR